AANQSPTPANAAMRARNVSDVAPTKRPARMATSATSAIVPMRSSIKASSSVYMHLFDAPRGQRSPVALGRRSRDPCPVRDGVLLVNQPLSPLPGRIRLVQLPAAGGTELHAVFAAVLRPCRDDPALSPHEGRAARERRPIEA